MGFELTIDRLQADSLSTVLRRRLFGGIKDKVTRLLFPFVRLRGTVGGTF